MTGAQKGLQILAPEFDSRPGLHKTKDLALDAREQTGTFGGVRDHLSRPVPELCSADVPPEPRRGSIAEDAFDGRAVSHHPISERYHCLAYPCPNTTRWFYIPAWSHLCMECMAQREATR